MENKVLDENKQKNQTEETLDKIVEELKKNIDVKSIKSIDWWKNVPHKEKFGVGDIVFVKDINKYGVICGPAKKEDTIKVVLLKKSLSKGYYNREWYISKDNLQLVRKNNRFQKGFICVFDKFYQVKQ